MSECLISEERVLEELKSHNPDVLRTNFSPEAEDALRGAVGAE